MKNKNIIITLFIIIIFIPCLSKSEDYQYQYFNNEKDKYVPFSDYIPKIRQHYLTVPHHLEDFYELYGMKQYYNETSLRKNIHRLKTAETLSGVAVRPDGSEHFWEIGEYIPHESYQRLAALLDEPGFEAAIFPQVEP